MDCKQSRSRGNPYVVEVSGRALERYLAETPERRVGLVRGKGAEVFTCDSGGTRLLLPKLVWGS